MEATVPRSDNGGQPRASSRSKRADILRVATAIFGRDGYEHSKWADVAAEVGIGSTALYHYFESKLHCLYVIMADALEADLDEFEQVTKETDDYVGALVKILRRLYDLDEQEVMRNRVLVSEQFLVGIHRESPREEEARQLARARMRDLEFAWATFLSRAMEQGAIPEADPRLLTRAVLGLHNSVWHWYRTGGDLTLDQVADFFVARCLAVLGLPTPTPATAAQRRRAA
jgi:TetR/AcrR family transcriptional regulator, cholesterol catabolism regulator